ncbi:MAG: DUF4162 domain-containing protein [Streptosporangiaceae bacterium]
MCCSLMSPRSGWTRRPGPRSGRTSTIHTADDQAATASLAAAFGIEAAMHEGAVTFSVAAGEQFVPRLFTELGVPIRSVSVSRPSLDDVFMSYTGRTIRDSEASSADAKRQLAMRFRGR